MVIEYAFVLKAQAINKANEKEPSVTHSDNKETFDETSVYEDSYTLEHWLEYAEYMVPSSENTQIQWSASESDKSESNLIWMIPT